MTTSEQFTDMLENPKEYTYIYEDYEMLLDNDEITTKECAFIRGYVNDY